jgi:hypothetical protein
MGYVKGKFITPIFSTERRFLCQNLLKNVLNAPNVNQILMLGDIALNTGTCNDTDVEILNADINLLLAYRNVLRNIPHCLALNVVVG